MKHVTKIGKAIKVLGGTVLSDKEKKHLIKMIIEGRQFAEETKNRRKTTFSDNSDEIK